MSTGPTAQAGPGVLPYDEPSTADRAKQQAMDAAQQAQEMAQQKMEQAKQMAEQYMSQGREKATELQRQIEVYVQQEPTKALLAAAGVGLALGFLLVRR